MHRKEFALFLAPLLLLGLALAALNRDGIITWWHRRSVPGLVAEMQVRPLIDGWENGLLFDPASKYLLSGEAILFDANDSHYTALNDDFVAGVSLWEVPSGKLLRKLGGTTIAELRKAGGNRFAPDSFSADGSLLVVGTWLQRNHYSCYETATGNTKTSWDELQRVAWRDPRQLRPYPTAARKLVEPEPNEGEAKLHPNSKIWPGAPHTAIGDVSPDGSLAFIRVCPNKNEPSYDDTSFDLYDLRTGRRLWSKPSFFLYQNVWFTSDSRGLRFLLTNAEGCTLVAYNPFNGQQEWRRNLHPFTDARISPDSRYISCTNPVNGEINLLDANTGALRRTLEQGAAEALKDDYAGYHHWSAFSPDGKWLATNNNHTIHLWEVGKL